MGDKFYRTPEERDPTGAKRLAAHGSWRSPRNIEMKGEDEGKSFHTDGGGIPSNTKQGTFREKPRESGGKPSSEYGRVGPTGPKGTRTKPTGASTPMSQRSGFES